MRQGHTRLLLVIGLAVTAFLAALTGLAYVFQQMVQEFFGHFHEKSGIGRSPGDFGNAGAYYSFVVGVPVAFLGALVGIVASGIFARYTGTRDEAQIFKFIEEAIDPVFVQINTLSNTLQNLIIEGNGLRRLAYQLDGDMSAERVPDESEDEPGEQLDPWERLEALLNADDGKLRSKLKGHLENIRGELEKWNSTFDALFGSMYAALFLRRRIDDVLSERRGTAVSYLRESLHHSLHAKIGIACIRSVTEELSWHDTRGGASYPNDPRTILENVIHFHSITASHHLLRTISFLSPEATTIEFLGAVIYLPSVYLKRPAKCPGNPRKLIESYCINVGAAWIITLYQYIPEENAIFHSFKRIFANKSEVALNFIKLASPSPRFFLQLKVDDSMRDQLSLLRRLIVVRTNHGNEVYDPKVHGKIPSAEHFDL